MLIEAQALKLDGAASGVRLTSTPDVCPRCHRSIHPKFLNAALQGSEYKCQATFRCTHQQCQELFIGTYAFESRAPDSKHHYKLLSVSPRNAESIKFPDVVVELSPTFVLISNQVFEAEAANLDQIVGMGLRKALEFLVKDYAISLHKEDEAAIQRTLLAKCIDTYISDVNVKECAKRAAWLGNDETHYVRKWESKDISDLKLLVRLTVNWIENSLLTNKYVAEMEAGKAT
jgi:hypothetical protein